MRAFDLFILNRPKAENEYSVEEFNSAKKYHKTLKINDVNRLTESIIAGLPGAEEGYALSQFNDCIKAYKHLNKKDLQQHLILFLKDLVPTLESSGIQMCIHPDDPPFSLFGIPLKNF